MKLQKRLDRLEGKRGTAGAGPSVILICDAESGEPRAALLMGGGGSTREAAECAEAFMARVTAGASLAFRLPDNWR